MNPDYSQAEGYVQLLMQEGKLEEDIIKETSQLFNLTLEEATKIVYNYKTKKRELYRQNVSSNVRVRLIQVIPLLLLGFLYTLFYLDSKNNFFLPLIIFMGLAVLGLVGYSAQLYSEKFNLRKRLFHEGTRPLELQPGKKTDNRFGIIILFIIAIILTFNHLTGKYLYNASEYVKSERLVLDAPCTLEYQSGKSGYHYYRFHFKIYSPEFRWRKPDHLEAFNFPGTPEKLLQAGDTIEIYTRPGAMATSESFELLYDILYHHKNWLNQEKRNEFAKEESSRNLILFYVVIVVFALISALLPSIREHKEN